MQEQYEKIEAYLNDELPAAERKAFEAAMTEDPALTREVNLHRRLATVLGDEQEWQLRQNLESLRDSVPDDQLEDGKPGKNRRAGGLLLGMLGLVIIASLLYWYATSDATTASETVPATEAPAPANEDEEAPLEEAENPPPVAEEKPAPPPPASVAPEPYAALPLLEALAKASPLSNIYEFELRSAVEGNAPKQLRLDGEMLSAQWEGQTPFVVEIFSNNPAQYPDRPVQEGELLLQPIEEDGPIAFAAKQAYIANYEAPVDLQPGLYYYQVRLQGLDEVLWVGRFRL